MEKNQLKNKKRLDGKKKVIHLTKQMENDLLVYRRNKGIESESELIRQAIAKYIYSDSSDDTFMLKGLEELRKKEEEIKDMLDLFFKYLRLTHISLLSYHPEIDTELADAAYKSALTRHRKFFDAFQESLKNDPPFFERLLHKYYTGENSGENSGED